MGSCTKVLFISFNVLCLMAGVAMFAGGMLIQFMDVVQNTLKTINNSITSTQIGGIGVGLIALGALVLLISLVGCCGAISESRGLLGVYFVCLLLLFIGQLAVGIAAFVYGYQGFKQQIEDQFGLLVRGYGNNPNEQAVVDFVQQNFQCCGYNGTNDYYLYNPQTPANPVTSNATAAGIATTAPAATTDSPPTVTLPMTANTTDHSTQNMTTAATSANAYLTGHWPVSCCKRSNGDYMNRTLCMDNTLPRSTLEMYLNTQGCTNSLEAFVRSNLIIIGGAALGIAFVEILAMVMACYIRKSID